MTQEAEKLWKVDDCRLVSPGGITWRSDLALKGAARAEAAFIAQACNAYTSTDALRSALEFYATAWQGHPGDSGPGGNDPQDPVWEPDEALLEDGGKRARAALSAMLRDDNISGNPSSNSENVTEPLHTEALRSALAEMIYETTHLSSANPDGGHSCVISGQTLAKARAALSGSPAPSTSPDGD